MVGTVLACITRKEATWSGVIDTLNKARNIHTISSLIYIYFTNLSLCVCVCLSSTANVKKLVASKSFQVKEKCHYLFCTQLIEPSVMLLVGQRPSGPASRRTPWS
jgi:hypothetical protein